jgi:hypothetical protein
MKTGVQQDEASPPLFPTHSNILIYQQLRPQNKIEKIVHNTRVAQERPWPESDQTPGIPTYI